MNTTRHQSSPLLTSIQVPVIAIFTKMDALDEEARNQLVREKVSFRNIKEQVPIHAKAIFEKKYLQRLQEVKHKPRYIIQLRGMLFLVVDTAPSSAIHHPDMDKEGTNCDELIWRTSQALNGNTLKLFCLSIFRNDVESRIKGVITK